VAELLIWITDKPGAAALTKGDVIAVQPDGWSWGRKELDNPEWRIWRLAGILARDLQHLTDADESKNARHFDLSNAEAFVARAHPGVLALTAQESKTVLSWLRDKPTLGTIG
jgi:hypothetical protein